jgi:hypothetical protein
MAATEDKDSWPELVGWEKDKAIDHLKQHTQGKQVIPVRSDAVVTMDWREDRIRVRYDPDTDKVTDPPRIG